MDVSCPRTCSNWYVRFWRKLVETRRLISKVIGFITYIWMVDFPENSHKSFHFLTAEEQAFAETRISDDRGDVKAEEFSYQKCLVQFIDPKLYGFCMLFFC
jgi:hypothetical protein